MHKTVHQIYVYKSKNCIDVLLKWVMGTAVCYSIQFILVCI